MITISVRNQFVNIAILLNRLEHFINFGMQIHIDKT